MATTKTSKLGITGQRQGVVLTDLNPDDFTGDDWFRAAPGAVAPEEAAPEGSGKIRRIAGDGLLTGIKSAIGFTEAAVGLANIPTGGAVGKFLENEDGLVGFRPKQAKEYLDQFYTPEQKAAFAAVQNAANPEDSLGRRVLDTASAALQNSSVIPHAVGESLAPMLAGGVAARGVLKGASMMLPGAGTSMASRIAAGGIGEGVVAAGATAEQIRQQTADGTLDLKQSLVPIAVGGLTGAIGVLGGKVAQRMGIGDVDTLLAGGKMVDPAMQKSFVRKVIEGAFVEGVLEELPQGVQEQVLQNYALGKPLDEGVDQAIVMGVLTGGVMGGGVQALSGGKRVPEVGPLSRGANLAPGTGAPPSPSGGAPAAPAVPPTEQPLDPADPFAGVPANAAPELQPIQPTDILNPSGGPFKTLVAAQRAATQTPGDVMPVDGGFVVRTTQEQTNADQGTAATTPDATAGTGSEALDPFGPTGVPADDTAAADAVGSDPLQQAVDNESGPLTDELNVQDQPTGADATQAQATPDQAPETGAGDAATAPAVPDTGRGGDAQADGVTPIKPVRKPNGFVSYDFTTNEGMNGRVSIAPPGWRKGTKSHEVMIDRTGGPTGPDGRTKFYPTVTIGKFQSEKSARAAAEKAVEENRQRDNPTPQNTRTPGPVSTPAQPQGTQSEKASTNATDEAQQEASAQEERVLSGEPGTPREQSASQPVAPARTDQIGSSPENQAKIAEAKAAEDAQAADDADMDGFKEGASVLARSAAREALNKNVVNNGRAITRKALVRDRIAKGATVQAVAGKRRLTNSDGSFLGEDQITKTGMDYAEHLIAQAVRAPAPAPAEKPAAAPESADQYEYGVTLKGTPERIEQGQRAIVDFMNGKITKPDLLQRMADLKLSSGDLSSITNRIPFTRGDFDEVARLQPPADTPVESDSTPAAPAPSANTIFTEDAAAAARARLKAKLGRLNSGIDPEMLMDGITLAGFHIEAGARSFAAYSRAMVADLGDGVKPYLKSWYMGIKYDPRAAGFDGMDSSATVEAADIERATAAEKPAEKPAPAPEPAQTDLTTSLYQAITDGNMPKDNPALKKLVEAFDGKPADPARMKQAQEALEAAIVRLGRDVIAKKEGRRSTFDILLRIYQSQPNLNIRTSTSVMNQAYSTPVPLAYLGSLLSGVNSRSSLYEPTAGNGMLTLGAKPGNVQVNELNSERQASLQAQGFKATTQNDASTFTPEGEFDVVHMNPPFGSVKDANGNPIKVKVDGYNIGQIDHLIAANALKAMKADGSAMLIIGANKATGQLSLDDRIFFNWLYGNYNVTGHFEVEGDLYTRQGAGWPVRVITIKGRQQSSKLAPVAGTIQRAQNWEQVYDYTTKLLDSSGQSDASASNSAVRPAGGQARPVGPPGVAGAQTARGNTEGARTGVAGDGDVEGAGPRSIPDRAEPAAEPVGDGDREQRLGFEPVEPDRLDKAGKPEKPAAAKPAGDTGADALATEGNQFQVPYTARSARKDAGVLIPANMAQPTQDALSRLEDEVGDIDEFVRKELGYKSVEELHGALMGLQVDSVATAIYQIKQGKAVVIADQTGIGKGRQAAAIIRWAARSGFTPVFISVKPSLFTDMYGDLADIGTTDINPFIINSDAWVAGEGGAKLFANKAGPHRARLGRLAETGTMPAGSNAVFMTYSQINVANDQRRALLALAPNAVFVLDESHNAAGDSATGAFMIDALGLAKGVTYLSATYAKRPDNMPLYFKTDIGKAAGDNDGLTDAMSAGGLPLQTVVSNNLVKAGQMFRRERSYDGVSIESKFDAPNRKLHEGMSNEATKALRAIVSADRMFHSIFVKQLSQEVAAMGAAIKDNSGNQASASVQHTEFSSVVHNFVKQMLLGLKAQIAADDAIASLKRGEKPIIAVENTMGSFLNEYASANGIAQGASLGSFDYRTVLSRALARTLVVTEKLPTGDEVKRIISLGELDAETRAAYDNAQKVIDGLSLDIPVSPIDWMRAEIQRAGFTVAEITGRNLSVDYTDPSNPTLSAVDAAEQKDKVSTTRRFNGGQLDALVLNVAGSTGISLHASEKFVDQRQRHMIVAQAAGDINVFMQMLGRIHRTGQVKLPKYTLLSVDLPTEKRPTAVLSNKMKSLNANTSSNTESATSVKSADILNKYGDQIVNQYLNDHFQLARQLGVDDLLSSDGKTIAEDLARKATGRLALQPIATQNTFYDEVEGQYNALIDYLNKTNQNDLEPRTFDFDAKELRQEVLFEGPDPTTPFGEDAIYGEYSIKAQGVPMKPAEIREAMATNLDGKTAVDSMAAMKAGLNMKYLAYSATLDDDGKAKATVTRNIGQAFMSDHKVGDMFRVDINSDTLNAVVINVRNTHKETGNPYSLSKIQVTVAVNGALRSVTVPATQFGQIEVSGLSSQYTVEQLFKEQPPGQRETAKIVTGNLLAAYGEIQGARGTIITFTKEDGTQEQGILLPKLFDYTKNTRGDFRLPTAADALKFLQTSDNRDIGRFGIMTRDSVVRVLPAGQGVRIQVPKSKAKGGKYFLDKPLIEAAGDFTSSGSFMVATVYEPKDAIKALDTLMKKQALYALPSMAEEAKALVGDKPTAFSRNPTQAGGQNAQRVQASVDQMVSRWKNKPAVVVVQNIDDPRVPAEIRDEVQALDAEASGRPLSVDNAGAPEGFIDRETNTIYLIADKLATDLDVARVLMHESLGHFGLRGLYGAELGTILDRMSVLNAAKVRTAAKRLGLDFEKTNERRMAAEEVLAYMAQNSPEMGWVKKAVAAVRSWMRENVPGFTMMRMSDSELIANYIIPARAWVESGGPSTSQKRGKGPAMSRGDSGQSGSSSTPDGSGSALEQIAQMDELFSLPKSTKTDLQGIAEENAPGIKIRSTTFPGGETMHTMTLPDGTSGRMTVRKSGPTSVYGANETDEGYDWIMGRPGDNPEDVPDSTEDVWIDVSGRAPGTEGNVIYNIAATFAHNTGRIFIGDPAGLSDEALRRRTEQMISSALKFGTTDHLAPHPLQVEGKASIGVPPLRWVYGDSEGNVERMVAASLKALDNAFPNAKLVGYDTDTGQFFRTDTKQRFAGREQLARLVTKSITDRTKAAGRDSPAGQAGWRTVARAAVFRAVVGVQGTAAGRGSLLERLGKELARIGSSEDGSGDAVRENRLFYSRTLSGGLTDALNSARNTALPAGYAVSDLFQGEGRLSWWHKTVGTQYNLAQRHPVFGRVFDSVQNFLNDVSYYAAESAELAPTILPKLDKITDILNTPLSPEDTKALSAPVFEGTLTWGRDRDGRVRPIDEIEAEMEAVELDEKAKMLLRGNHIAPNVLRMWQGLPQEQYEGIINGKFETHFLRAGVVFTDAELRQHFNLTDEQIGHYREFRAATDKSIDQLAISEMLNYAADDALPIRDIVLEMPNLDEAANTLREYLLSIEDEGRATVLSGMADKALEVAAHAKDLKDRGYAPLSRHGNYTLEATLSTGERYFSMFETDLERNKASRLLGKAGATGIVTGTMSQEAYKMFAGMSPETAALFGEILGLDEQGNRAQDIAFQEFVKRGTANRSAMKRLLKRQGIAGFSNDAGRVLAGFVYSNARRTSSNLHAKETSKAIAAIPKEQGELKDAAIKLQAYVSNPQEEAQALRAVLFAQYLGGSIASAMVNATQPFAVTLPWLSQFGGIRKAGVQMAAAVRDATKGETGDARLDAAMKKAEEEGIVSPQEVFALQAQAMGRAQLRSGDGTLSGNTVATANNALNRVSLAWGKVFSLAEQFNRRTTFIAAFRTAVEQGMADPAQFARRAVNDTQFVYSKAAKPRWARGAVGSVLFTFKLYTINYVELVSRMANAGEPGSPERKAGRKAAVLALAALFLLAGADGLPFIEDVQDVIDGAMQRMGYNFSSKAQMRSFLARELGTAGANVVMEGISGVAGVPIDISGRLGMGNLIPGTGIFMQKQNHSRDLLEMVGPAGDLFKRGLQATNQALAGDLGKAVVTASPVAVRNAVKAEDMQATGMYRDTRGRKVIDTTGTEAAFKAIGFQPNSVAAVQRNSREIQKAKGNYDIAVAAARAKMAEAIFLRDEDMKREARGDVAAWNQKNPGQRIDLDMPTVLRRVREMRKTRQQRMADTAPKALRENIRAVIRENAP
jgi:hypothetical protein